MPPKRKRGVDADDDDEKDLQLFRDHRRVYLKTKPGYHKDKTRAASNRMWKEFTQEQKDAKVKRIREAVTAGTALEDLPLEEGKEEKDSSDDGEGNDGEGNDGEGNDGEGNDGEGNNAATNDLEWLPDTNRENDEYADSSSDSNASLGGPAAGVYREDDDADWGTAKLVERKQKARKEYAQKQAPRYNPPTYDNALWKYQRHLGSGRDGSANLWVLVDDNDQILFRIAVKDCWTLGPSFWGSAKFWHGDPHDANTRVPTEVRAMQVCSGQPGGNRIVGILTHSVDDDRMVYRIIMPFYPHGDIISIIDQTEDPFPEAFIWYVFEALTDACLVMQRGTTAKLAPSAPAPVEDWKEIVHRDIKPDNIFLDAPHPTNFPSYPQPVLADFGACIMTSENDALNPTAYADSQGTEGYYAPEQHAYQDRTTFEQVFLARQQSWTNIFQIGRVVLSLMNAPVDDKEDQYLLNGQIVYFLSRDPLYADPKAWKDHRWLKEGAKHRYSKQLAKLVMKCVKYLPNQRIAAQRLKGKILRRTGGVRGAEDFTGGLRGRKRRVGEEGRLRKWMRKERYAVGMVRPEE